MADELRHKDAAAWLTESEWEGIGSHILNSQATGDMVYASSTTQLSRVGIGSTEDRLEVASGIPAWVAPDGSARVYDSSNQSISDATRTALTFDSERFDTDGIHSTVTNTSRLTCQTAGVYVISEMVAWDGNATGFRQTGVRLNGSTLVAESTDSPTSSQINQTICTIYKLAVSDYVELTVRQNSGGSLNVLVFGNYSPEFAMAKILG